MREPFVPWYRATMGVRDVFTLAVTGGSPQRYYECRRCGKTLDAESDACPNCDGPVTTYEL